MCVATLAFLAPDAAHGPLTSTNTHCKNFPAHCRARVRSCRLCAVHTKMVSAAEACPIPGFVAKLTAPDGTRHYVNIGAHPIIERPLRPDDREVDDVHLRTRGLENLRVPLLTGVARTVLLSGTEEEAVCMDVVFNPAVLDVALAGASEVDADDESKPKVKKAVGKNGDIDPDLAKFVRIRIIELALKTCV